jgi:hypothetical protein
VRRTLTTVPAAISALFDLLKRGTSAATPNPASSYSATTGLFSGASGQVSVTSTGNEIARFTGRGVSVGTTYVSTAAPTNGLVVQGNVGIGTTSASFPLTVAGDMGPDADSTRNIGSSSVRYSSVYARALSAVASTLHIMGGTVLLQESSGNVGIGTTSPDALVSLGGQSAQTIDMVRETTASTAGNNLTLQAGGATPLGTDKAGGTLALSSGISTGTGSSGINFNIYQAAGSSGSADNAATTAMTITGAGNVAIGTTTSIGTSALTAVSSNTAVSASSSGNIAAISGVGAGNQSASIGVQGTVSGSFGTGVYGGAGNATAGTGVYGTARGSAVQGAGLNSGYGGNFSSVSGIGVYASSTSGYALITGTGNVGIGTTAPAYLLHVGSPTAVGVVADFQNSSGYCTFSPSANGILTTCTSDVRLKKDIVDAGDALAWLGTMRIRDFTLKATGERRTGVIAQEMMKVHPEMVRMGSTGFYQVDVPDAWKLIKAIQELKAENDDLVNRIGAEDNALKAANTTSPTCARRSKRTKLSIREQRSKRHRFAIKSVAL